MSDLYHPDKDRVISNQLVDPESFVINQYAKPGAIDAKPSLKLRDLYPDIEKFRVLPTSVYTDPALVKKEWDRLWTQTWLLRGPRQRFAQRRRLVPVTILAVNP